MFSFPETFPGFDPKTVFIRKGDKQKAKLRKEERGELEAKGLRTSDLKPWKKIEVETRCIEHQERQRQLDAERQRLGEMGKQRLARKQQNAKGERQHQAKGASIGPLEVLAFDGNTTYPKSGGLRDRAFNKVVSKKNTKSILPPANFVPVASPRLAAPIAGNAGGKDLGRRFALRSFSHPSLETAGEKESRSLRTIVSLQPQFRSLILTVLSQIRKREHINQMVGFVDKLARNNPNITAFEHLQELAQELENRFKEEFLTDLSGDRARSNPDPDEPRKHKRGYNQLLQRMFNFFRRAVTSFEPQGLLERIDEDDGDDVPFCRLDDDSILGMDPDLPTILEALLEPANALDLIPCVSSLIETRVEENGTIVGKSGRLEIGDVLLEKLYTFYLHEGHKRVVLPRLYRFLHCYLGSYAARSYSGSWMHFRCDLAEEAMAELTGEFPWLDPEYQMTARQQQRAKRAIKRLKPKLLTWRPLKNRMQQSEDGRIRELAV